MINISRVGGRLAVCGRVLSVCELPNNRLHLMLYGGLCPRVLPERLSRTSEHDRYQEKIRVIAKCQVFGLSLALHRLVSSLIVYMKIV